MIKIKSSKQIWWELHHSTEGWLCLVAQLWLPQLFATSWTVARQVPLSMGILQARILEWVALVYHKGKTRILIIETFKSHFIFLFNTVSPFYFPELTWVPHIFQLTVVVGRIHRCPPDSHPGVHAHGNFYEGGQGCEWDEITCCCPLG